MKRYVHNDTARVQFIGGVMIPPGEGREVDAALLPPQAEAAAPAPAEPPPDPDANLREVLAGNIRQIEPLLADASDDTLAGLVRLEQASDTPRSTLLEKLAAEQLRRANGKVGEPT